MRVLSLFDGISCGMLALQRAGISFDFYGAFEIDSEAIAVSRSNFDNIVYYGSVVDADFKQFRGKIDLLIGGSPCQNMSTLGDRKGLGGNKSSLFYEYKRALDEIQPKYFLLENNANMPEKDRKTITKLVGGKEPVEINSALVSAQDRKRLYWSNFKIEQPEDKHILLSEYKDDKYWERVELKDFALKGLNKLLKKTGGIIPEFFNTYNARELKDKAPCLTTALGTTASSSILYNKNGNVYLGNELLWEQMQTLPENYTRVAKKSKRKKLIANGWTVDVIVHIFQQMVQKCS